MKSYKENWPNIVSLVIIPMLLLTPKASVSQEVIIDSINKTVLLRKNKVVTIGKIIQNEQALYEENQLLKEANQKLVEQLEKTEIQLRLYTEKYTTASDAVVNLQQRIINDSDEVLKKVKKSNNLGFYAFGEIGTPLPDLGYNHLQVGMKMVNKKTFYSFSINPINYKLIYAVGFGYRLF